MHQGGFLCKLCALILIFHIEVVGQCQGMKEHISSLSGGYSQRIAFYALRSCHQVLQGNSGEFFSPDYLCSNPALWCNWTIQVPPGKRVQVYLEDLTPEQECHLKTDQIHLDESPLSASESSILESCWRSSMYTSFSNTVHVVQLIRPNPNPPHRGFYAVYQAFGLPQAPDLNEDVPRDVKKAETEAEPAATYIPKQKSFSHELEENVDAYIKHVEVSAQINPPLNEILTVTTGSFKEIRKIRGEDKDKEEPFHDTLIQDEDDDDDDNDVDDQLVSVPTRNPNWITTEKLVDHVPQTSTTQSTSASTTKQSTRKKAPKIKPSTTKATVNKTDVKHFSHVASQIPDEPKVTVTPTPSFVNIGAISMEMLKTDSPVTLQEVFKEHAGESAEYKPKSKKIKQSHGIKGQSLPAQTFRLATEPPPFSEDCGRTSVPTLLYVVCFLLCFLILLLMVALGLTYRRSHRGTFLPHCPTHNSSNFTESDINNNPNAGSGDNRSPPPPPPLRLTSGAHDIPLLRFSPLTSPDGTEGKPLKENETL